MLKKVLGVGAVIFLVHQPLLARSQFRPQDPQMPRIETRWQQESESFTLRDYHLTEYSLFQTFDEKFFNNHLLPSEKIVYRADTSKTVSGEILKKLIDELIDEMYAGKKTFKHFTIIRNRDFNSSEFMGLIILKFNDYPFVVKLFMETPKSLASPYSKGIVPLFTFYMGGGINRHLIGFTRIKNLEIITAKIKADPSWSTFIDTPRKWFLRPNKSKWIEITGHNFGTKEPIKKCLPGTYCIIADAIESSRKTSMLNKRDNTLCLDVCKFLDFWIDPHIDNFMWEAGTNKLVVVDTEHFPSLMGFEQNMMFDSYVSWLTYLAGKFLNDTFFRSKAERRSFQTHTRVVC